MVGGDTLVTVVVPIRNEVRSIGTTLQDIVAQTYRSLEILVVDGESDDGTVNAVEAWATSDERIRLISNPRRTAASALNIGLAAARGRWFVRVDGHVRIPEDYVEHLVAHLETMTWGGVGGRKDAVGEGLSAKAIAAVLGSKWGVGGSLYHYAAEPTEVDHVPFGAYPVALARELGGWDERLVANQDFEFDARVREAGYRLLVDPSVATAWQCRERIRDLGRQYLRYGRGKADVARLHPASVRFRHLAPPALVAASGVSFALVPWSVIPIAGLGIAYAAAVGAATVAIGRNVAVGAARIRIPAALITMHYAWGTGFWMGLGRLARHGFRVPDLVDSGRERWGSPRWELGQHGTKDDGDHGVAAD